jgi:hypothetical protein
MKDRHLWFLIFAIGFFCVMIIISFIGKNTFDKILLNLYGWTILVTVGTAIYYGILYFRNKNNVDALQVKASKESKNISKIATIILIVLFMIPIIIKFVFGVQPSLYFNQIG